MSKTPGNVPPKAGKLGLGGAKKPTGIASAASAMKKAITGKPAPKPTAFKGASVKSNKEMKPTSPVIGTRGNTKVNGLSVESGRMKDRVKKAGLGGL